MTYAREPSSPARRLATGAQDLRRGHQALATSSTVRELNNGAYQLAQQEARVLNKQAASKKLTARDVEVLAEAYSDTMGHAGAVVLHPNGTFEGAHDPRADGGAAGV